MFGEVFGSNENYRSCPECGADCLPDPFETNQEIRIAFICPLHGVQTVVDRFPDFREH